MHETNMIENKFNDQYLKPLVSDFFCIYVTLGSLIVIELSVESEALFLDFSVEKNTSLQW